MKICYELVAHIQQYRKDHIDANLLISYDAASEAFNKLEERVSSYGSYNSPGRLEHIGPDIPISILSYLWRGSK